jgi:hypothetical protein
MSFRSPAIFPFDPAFAPELAAAAGPKTATERLNAQMAVAVIDFILDYPPRGSVDAPPLRLGNIFRQVSKASAN